MDALWQRMALPPHTPKRLARPDEGHIEVFNLRSQAWQESLFPLQLLGLMIGLVYGMGIWNWMLYDEQELAKLCFGLGSIFAPVYLVAMGLYFTYWRRERHTEIEIDSREQLISYKSDVQHLLFQWDQIEACEIIRTDFLPYSLHYVRLYIRGGKSICISNLIAEPEEIVAQLAIPSSVQRRFFNAFPERQIV